MAQIKITIVYDDYNGAEEGFILSFGFAALIEKENKKILFDTGTEPEVLLHNLDLCGITPSQLDAVILSHNHYDHTNGILGILRENPKIPVYAHKYWSIPVNFQGLDLLKQNLILNQKARECIEICPSVFLTNTLSSQDYGGIHEQACYIKSGDSYILLCGCCHPGLINFLNERKQLSILGSAPLYLIGGFHGFEFTHQEAKILNPIIKSIILCHCTMYCQTFKSQFGEKTSFGIVGKTLYF